MSAESESVWWTTLNEPDRRLLTDFSSTLLDRPDVVVVGGGLIGLAVAYFAALQNQRVQVLTDARLAQDADCSLGLVVPNACAWQFAPGTQPLAQSSRDWWAKLAVRPEFQLDWRVTGAVMVDEHRLAPEPRQHMLAALEAGYSVHHVDAEQITLLEPLLAACPGGGLHYPSEAVINPMQAACGFIRSLQKRGGQVCRAAIEQIDVTGERLTRVRTAAGDIQPRDIFFADDSLVAPSSAAPVMADRLRGRIGMPSHRVFLGSGRQPPLLKQPILDANWIVQIKSGEVLIEANSAVETDSAKGIGPQTESVLAAARARIPALQTVEFDRVWWGTSQQNPSAQPVVDRIPGLENAWYCTGLDFASALFAPIIGKSLADWMQNRQRPDEFASFAAPE